MIKTRPTPEALPGQMDIEDVTGSPQNLKPQHEVLDPFTYAKLSREDEVAAREDEARIKQGLNTIGRAAIEIGQCLIRQKSRLSHGQFLAWVRDRCDLSHDGAQQLMRVANVAKANTGLNQYLEDGLISITAIDLTYRKTTPQSVIDHVEALLVDGEKVTAADIKRLKAEKKPEFILPKPSKSSEIESLNAKIRDLTAKQDEDAQRLLAAEDKLKRAAADLRKAQAETREAEKLPVAEPLSEEQKAEQRRVFGTQEDRAIGARIDEIIDRIKEQPSVEEAVSRVPPAEIHTIDTTAIRSAGKWLLEFAEAWEARP
jgi:outer membrane murein-binding lipoprotein Lpp